MPAAARSVADLTQHLARGGRVKYLFFWGHKAEPGGRIGAGCLSQWWSAPFTVDGVTFATAEHYMMWRKAMLFDDPVVAERIVAATHPSKAKALGRTVRDFDEQIWRGARFDIVVAGSTAKFGQHGDLREYLLGTGNRVLVEASPRDRIWGIGMAASNEHAAVPVRWRGLNLLGFALMAARATLAAR